MATDFSKISMTHNEYSMVYTKGTRSCWAILELKIRLKEDYASSLQINVVNESGKDMVCFFMINNIYFYYKK